MKVLDRLAGPLVAQVRDRLIDQARYRLHYVQQTVDPIRQARGPHGLKIVCLDVNHGDATLIIFPTGGWPWWTRPRTPGADGG